MKFGKIKIMNMEPISITISDAEILDLLSNYKEDKRDLAITKALKIGLIALKDIETVGNVDYVEKEFQKFKADLDKEFISLKDEFQNKLKETDEIIKDKLNRNFDPETGIMQQVLKQYLGEGGKLSDLFDEKNNTSAVSKIKNILSDYFDTDASRVVKLLDPNNPESPLSSFKKEIEERLFAIEKEIKAKESAREATREEAEKGTKKGLEYQNLVFAEVEKIARILGDDCKPTGNETGLLFNSKLGDVVVTINPSQTNSAVLKIVFEAKDKEMSLSGLITELDGAKKNRGSEYAIGVISGNNTLKDAKGLIGSFRDYPKNKTLCILDKETIDPIALEVAYKLARTKLLLGLQAHEQKSESVDIDSINTLIDEIIKKLSDFSTIKGVLTKASGAISNAQTQIENLKLELESMLHELSEKTKPVIKK